MAFVEGIAEEEASGALANLFAAGGIQTVTAGATDGVDDVVAAFGEAGSPSVVCLTGPDAL